MHIHTIKSNLYFFSFLYIRRQEPRGSGDMVLSKASQRIQVGWYVVKIGRQWGLGGECVSERWPGVEGAKCRRKQHRKIEADNHGTNQCACKQGMWDRALLFHRRPKESTSLLKVIQIVDGWGRTWLAINSGHTTLHWGLGMRKQPEKGHPGHERQMSQDIKDSRRSVRDPYLPWWLLPGAPILIIWLLIKRNCLSGLLSLAESSSAPSMLSLLGFHCSIIHQWEAAEMESFQPSSLEKSAWDTWFHSIHLMFMMEGHLLNPP